MCTISENIGVKMVKEENGDHPVVKVEASTEVKVEDYNDTR